MRTKKQYLKDLVNNVNPFPETVDEVIWFTEFTEHEPQPKLPDVLKSFWSMKVHGYLKRNVDRGVTEFRISMQDDKQFIIHPLGVDGETLDFQL